MPELPEVETTRRGLAPLLVSQRIRAAVVRNHALREPVPRELPRLLAGATVSAVDRRGKYLLIECAKNELRDKAGAPLQAGMRERGTLILHLGMSGRLWVVDAATPPGPHDHFDLVMENGKVVRLRDPRRFGLVLWREGRALDHRLLARIGPEPLAAEFDGAALYRATRGRRAAIKLVLMDSRTVAGIGNIYANEALFRAGINPRIPAHRVGRARCERLADAVKHTLELAISAGGSSLRDYVGSDGMAGNFQSQFMVYDRTDGTCPRCGGAIRAIRQAQRSTFYCPRCQRA